MCGEHGDATERMRSARRRLRDTPLTGRVGDANEQMPATALESTSCCLRSVELVEADRQRLKHEH